MNIRLATAQDVKPILVLYKDFFAHNAAQQPQYYRHATAYANYPDNVVKSDSADIFVATDNDNGVVGFMHISEDHTPPFEVFLPLKFANIIDLYVHHNFRNQGIGAKLLDAASQWAKNRALYYIELNVLFENRNAIKFYEHLGYKKVSHIMRLNL